MKSMSPTRSDVLLDGGVDAPSTYVTCLYLPGTVVSVSSKKRRKKKRGSIPTVVTNLQKIAEFPLIFFSDIEILFINCSMFFKPERDLGSFKNPIYYDLRTRRSVPFRFCPFSFFDFIYHLSGDHCRFLLDWLLD